ncbi:hypothetical protein ACVK00_005689 [Burkholderia sp. PvR073]|uniref:hypothetical protein n=1 Tax=Burkholderia ambifaria TaxID=152480 RepID=UPI003396CEE8
MLPSLMWQGLASYWKRALSLVALHISSIDDCEALREEALASTLARSKMLFASAKGVIFDEGNMKNTTNENAGPGWGIAAGVILTLVGLSLSLFPRALNSTGTLNDFLSSGIAMMGIFLVVYSVHELRRKHHH